MYKQYLDKYFVTAQPTQTQYFVTAQPTPTRYFVTAQPTQTQYFVTAQPTTTRYFVTDQPTLTQYFVTAQPTLTQYFVTAQDKDFGTPQTEIVLPIKKEMTMICKFNRKLEYQIKIGKLSITRIAGFFLPFWYFQKGKTVLQRSKLLWEPIVLVDLGNLFDLLVGVFLCIF